MRGPIVLASLLLLVGGCVTPSEGQAADLKLLDLTDPVVVAVIDTGVTPYIPAFASDKPLPLHLSELAETFSIATKGSYDERVKEDARRWESVEPGQLYWFEGTRLLGITFDPRWQYKLLDQQVAMHGTATSYLVARDAPEVIIVGVQIGEGFGVDSPDIMHPTVADAMEWVADQEWIDVVSISRGFIGNPPSHSSDPEMQRYVRASQEASAAGKIIVNSAGNLFVPSALHGYNGPPWVITVGGAVYGGEALEASRLVDVVANYSEMVPKPWTVDELSELHGTSVATPNVAATLARAMSEVRLASAGTLPAAHLYREALNASAIYFAPTEWETGTIDPNDPLGTIFEHSIPIVAQPQMGWGYVDASLASEIARRVLAGDLAVPPGKEQAAIFQPRWQEARESYWASVDP